MSEPAPYGRRARILHRAPRANGSSPFWTTPARRGCPSRTAPRAAHRSRGAAPRARFSPPARIDPPPAPLPARARHPCAAVLQRRAAARSAPFCGRARPRRHAPLQPSAGVCTWNRARGGWWPPLLCAPRTGPRRGRHRPAWRPTVEGARLGNAENGRSTFVGGGWVAKSSGAFLKFAPQTDMCRYSKFVRTPKYFCRPKVGRRVRTAQNRATRRFKKEAKSAPIPYDLVTTA